MRWPMRWRRSASATCPCRPPPRAGIVHSEQHRIAFVLWLAGDIHLRDEAALAGRADREMDVRRAAGVRHRPDRQKLVPAGPVRHHLPKPLEIVVARPPGVAVA